MEQSEKGSVSDLVRYRLETAKSDLQSLANFNKDYVRTEIFPKTFGRRIARAEEIRHASDYDDFYVATKEKAEEQIETADELIQEIETYCQIRQKNIVALNKSGEEKS